MRKGFILVGVQNLKIKAMNIFKVNIIEDKEKLKTYIDIALTEELHGKSFVNNKRYICTDGNFICICDKEGLDPNWSIIWTSDNDVAFTSNYYISKFIDDNEDISNNEIGILNYNKLDKLQKFILLISREKFAWENNIKYWKAEKDKLIKIVMDYISKNFPKDNKNI